MCTVVSQLTHASVIDTPYERSARVLPFLGSLCLPSWMCDSIMMPVMAFWPRASWAAMSAEPLGWLRKSLLLLPWLTSIMMLGCRSGSALSRLALLASTLAAS